MTKQTKIQSTDIISSFEHVHATLETAREQAAQLIAELDAKIKTARGTGDVTSQAAAAVAAAQAPGLPARVEAALRLRPMSVDDLARHLGAPATRVLAAMKPVRKRLHNSGTEDRPRWSVIVGDDATPQDLYALVEGLMRDRPHTNAELVVATGARSNRAGAINEMRRTRAVINAGDAARARWFIVPDGTKLAKLTR